MSIPMIQGMIRRRILANYRVDPAVMHAQLPAGFQPKLQKGHAIAGICLIRLEQIRPRRLPSFLGLSSENAAHRIAVVWEEEGTAREGVFIVRRDTDSLASQLLGGRLFPGEHHAASFCVEEAGNAIRFAMKSTDGDVRVELEGEETGSLPSTSVFKSVEEASRFFEEGSVGYSGTRDKDRLDGLKLVTDRWKVRPLRVDRIYSTYFANQTLFPPGSAEFDHALLMRDIPHAWVKVADMHI